jgi:uncharacterized protein (DUF1330 family)
MGEPFMTVYVVGQLKFTDRAAYERYAARFRGVLKQFGGRLLAADEQPEIIEGRWDRDKIVRLSFSNATAFRGFFESFSHDQDPSLPSEYLVRRWRPMSAAVRC